MVMVFQWRKFRCTRMFSGKSLRWYKLLNSSKFWIGYKWLTIEGEQWYLTTNPCNDDDNDNGWIFEWELWWWIMKYKSLPTLQSSHSRTRPQCKMSPPCLSLEVLTTKPFKNIPISTTNHFHLTIFRNTAIICTVQCLKANWFGGDIILEFQKKVWCFFLPPI